MIGFEFIQIDVVDVLALVRVETYDFILELGDLEQPLGDEVGGCVGWGTYQNARDLLQILHPVGYDGSDYKGLSTPWWTLDDR